MVQTRVLTVDDFVLSLGKYIGNDEASRAVSNICKKLGIEEGVTLSLEQLNEIISLAESSLGESVGSAMARAVTTDGLEINPDNTSRFYESFYRIRNQLVERQRKAQKYNEELTRLKELYENMSQSAPIGLFSVDMELKITSWNKEMENISGIETQDALFLRAQDIAPEYVSQMNQALKARKVISIDRTTRILADDQLQILSLTLSPLLDKYDVLHGLVLIVQDITERVEFEKSMLRAEKLASVGRLAAGVAHEVGNPLTSISFLVQELVENGGKDKQLLGNSLNLVNSHINRITGILNNLVDYSHGGETSFAPCHVSDIVDKAAPLIKLDKRGNYVELKMNIEDDLPKVHCDAGQIQQVLINLLFNAADAMNGEGEISLSASKNGDNTVSIKVSDRGCGMAADTLEKVFNPFFTTKPVGQGTGLGLYVCHNIVENHNSKLTVKSSPGCGASFQFNLQVANV